MSKWRNGYNDFDEYSTNEIRTHKTFNGKPIYRKCYYSATNWADNTVLDTIQDLDIMLFMGSMAKTSDDSTYYNFDITSSRCDVRVQTSTNKVIVTRGGVFANQQKPSVVVLEYTKTTD